MGCCMASGCSNDDANPVLSRLAPATVLAEAKAAEGDAVARAKAAEGDTGARAKAAEGDTGARAKAAEGDTGARAKAAEGDTGAEAITPRVRSGSPTRITVLAFLMLTQCVCGSNSRPTDTDAVAPQPIAEAARPGTATAPEPKPEPKPALSLPATLDTKDLDEHEKALLQEVLEEQYDPCGKSRSFLDSLRAADSCDEAKKLGALAVQKIADGLSKKQVIQELLKEQSRWASKMDFDVKDSPHHGEPGLGKKVVVEFFDYQCPHCKLTAKTAAELVEKANAVIYYKMLPLEIHPVAKGAALAALAAHRQGKFFALHDLIFEHQEALTSELVRVLASKAGLDMAKFDADLKDPTLTKMLERDLEESVRAKIDGTPTFYVDGYQVEYDQLEAALK